MERDRTTGEGIDSRFAEGTLVVNLSGYLNATLGGETEKIADAALDGGGTKILLNFEATRLVNSVGISSVLNVADRVERKGGTVAMCALSRMNRELFQMTGVARRVKAFETETDALAWLRGV
jgi:anti-anti-sigma factor